MRSEDMNVFKKVMSMYLWTKRWRKAKENNVGVCQKGYEKKRGKR